MSFVVIKIVHTHIYIIVEYTHKFMYKQYYLGYYGMKHMDFLYKFYDRYYKSQNFTPTQMINT